MTNKAYRCRRKGIVSLLLAFFMAFGVVGAVPFTPYDTAVQSEAATSSFTASANGTTVLRASPSETAVIVKVYPKGTSMTVTASSGNYYKAEVNGKAGYVLKTEVSKGNAVTTAPVNLRKGAGTGYDVIKTAETGSRVTVLSKKNGWYKVIYDSSTGYMTADYITRDTVGTVKTVTDKVASVNAACGLYSDMSASSTKLQSLPIGTEVQISGAGLTWCSVRVGSTSGYVKTSCLRRGNAAVIKNCKVRSSANSSSDVVASAAAESRVTLVKEGTTWSQVIYNGQKGFILTKNIKKDKVYSSAETQNTIYSVSTATRLYESIGGSSLEKLPAGTTVKLIEKTSSEYYEVKADGKTGYVKASDLKYGNAALLADDIALKEAPDSSSSTIRTLNHGARIAVYSASDGWAKIMYGTAEGYIQTGVYEKDYTTGEDYNPSLKTFHTKTAAKLYKTASTSSTVLLSLSKGSVGYRIGSSGNYWKVIVNNKVGYIPKSAFAYGNGVVTAVKASIISSASPKASTVGTVKAGGNLNILAEEGNYYKVSSSKGDGYILKAYVLRITKNYEYSKQSTVKTSAKATLTKTASSSGKSLRTVKKGTAVYVLSVGKKFTKVAVGNYLGYLPNSAVTVYSSGKTTQKLNMYESAVSGSAKLVTIPSGAKISIIKDYDNNYMKVMYDGKTGYVLSCYVKRTNASEYTWKYSNGWKYAYDVNGNRVRDVSDLVSGPYIVRTYKYSAVTVVLAKDTNGSYDIPVKIMICSPGQGTITGTYYSPSKYTGLVMLGNTYAYWLTDISGSYLYHTVPCWTDNHFDLEVGEFNLLGQLRSAGCVRLMSCDAKYIHDTMPSGQQLEIVTYSSPFKQPSGLQLSSSHTWDPTDPTAHWKCTQNGCH